MGKMIERYDGTGEAIPDGEDRSGWLPLPRRRRNPDFHFGHLPTRWTHVYGTGWVPSLTMIQHRPGANGVRAIGSGPSARIDPSAALLSFEAKGGTVIKPKDRRLPQGDYRRRHKCSDGGWHFTGPHESFVKFGRRVTSKCDRDAQNEWLLSLVDAGIIDPMAEEVLDMIVDRLESRLASRQAQPLAGVDPIRGGKINDLAATIDAMRADWARQFGPDAEPIEPPAPKPKTVRRRKKVVSDG